MLDIALEPEGALGRKVIVVDAPVRIENRSQLIYLLTEAAELEHGIMCCYLFAAFSIKSDVKEGVTEEQLSIIRRWRGNILQIAMEEMVHLSLACNLLTAVGGTPHLGRPNLPISPKAYPPSFSLELVPFGRKSLESFILIERPEEEVARPGSETNPGTSLLSQVKISDIFPSAQEYDNQGRLYRGLEDGLQYLAQKYGEDGLFIGPKEAQIADAYFSMPGLAPVTDLTSAAAALQVIVEQGEGSRGESTVSHHGRFVAIQDEYEQILRDDPKFEPGRNAMRNPYSMLPNDIVDYGEVNLIDDPLSGDICNLFDGCYALLMQMFGRLLLHSGESELQLTRLADITVALMLEVIGPLGETLTSLPAGPSHPGMMAGPSFRLSRDVSSPPHQTAAWALFIERLKELSAYCAFLQIRGVMPEALTQVKRSLAQYAEQLSESSRP